MNRKLFFIIVLIAVFLISRDYVFSIDDKESVQISLEVVSTCGNGNCESENTEKVQGEEEDGD